MRVNVKIVVAIFMIGLVTRGDAQLSCYVCENCADGKGLADYLLKSCSAEVTTTPTQTSTFTPTTVPSVKKPVDKTAETLPADSTETTTEPSSESTVETSAEPTAESTESSVEQSTESTIPEDPTRSTVEIVAPPIPTLVSTTTGRPTETPRPSTNHSGYSCFAIRNRVNGTQRVNRGCVVASLNSKEMCAKANKNTTPLECRICITDKCNSASGAIVSVFLLICSIFTISMSMNLSF